MIGNHQNACSCFILSRWDEKKTGIVNALENNNAAKFQLDTFKGFS